ncbi:MAG: hypothetical protein Q9159_006552 [Coniocarpon cinnabarinum]
MTDTSLTFTTARDLLHHLDALPLSKRKLIRTITITNPILILQLHCPEVSHLPKRFSLDEVLSLVPGLQLDHLIIDLRNQERVPKANSTSLAATSTMAMDYRPYWKMLNGLLKESQGWRQLWFWPSPGMLMAWERGFTGGVPAGQDAAASWDALIRTREDEGVGASVKVFQEAPLMSPMRSATSVSRLGRAKSEVKEKEEDKKEDVGEEMFVLPELKPEDSKEESKEEKVEEDDDDTKPPSKLPRFSSSTPRKRKSPSSNSTISPLKPSILIIARRSDGASIETYETARPTEALNILKIMLGGNPKKVTWKKLMEAEDNVEVKKDTGRSLKGVREDRETTLEIMRLLGRMQIAGKREDGKEAKKEKKGGVKKEGEDNRFGND